MDGFDSQITYFQEVNNTSENNTGNVRIAKNTLFLYIRLVFVLIISLYTSRVILHNLGVVDYGIYNVVAGFVSMFALLNTSFSNSSQRFYNSEKGKNGIEGMQKVFISAHYIQIIIAVLILILAETVVLWYVANKMVYPSERTLAVHIVYQSSVIALLFVVLQIPYSAAIIAHEKINYYAIVGVLDVVMKLIIALILPIIPSDSLSVYGVLIAGVGIIDFSLYFLYCRHHFPYLRFKWQFQQELFRAILKYSGWKALNSFSQVVRHQGLNILMNLFFGPAVNAARGISYQVKSALLGFVMNITTAAQPQVVESYAIGNIERSKKLMFTISKFIFLSLYVVSLPIIIEISYILRLWLGNEIPDYTEIFTIIVLVTGMIDILSTPISMVIAASGQVARFDFWNSIIGMTALPIAYFVLNKGGNPVTVFIVSLLVSIVMFIVALFIMRKEIGIQLTDYYKGILLPLVSVVIITAGFPWLVSYSLQDGFLRLFVVTIVSVLVVISCGFYIGLDANERTLVVTYVKHYVTIHIKKQ